MRGEVQEYDDQLHRAGAVRALRSVRRVDGSYPPPQDTGDDLDELAAWLFGPPAEARWVAVLDGEVVGHVCLTVAHDYLARRLVLASSSAVLLEVSKLYVAPEARGLDLGRRLLDAVLDGVAARDAVASLAVLPVSSAAVSLYRDRGLAEVGRFDGVHGLNLVFVDVPDAVEFVDLPT